MPKSHLTPRTVAPRFVRMLLSTSWAHGEAGYKRAGVPTISLEVSPFSGTISEIAACARLRLHKMSFALGHRGSFPRVYRAASSPDSGGVCRGRSEAKSTPDA